MSPFFTGEKARKRRSQLRDSMSEWSSKCISIACGTCMTISISSCGYNYNIRIVGSFGRGNDEFSFLLYLSLRGKRWIRVKRGERSPWGAKQSILCFLRHLDCHVNRHRIRLIPRNDGNRGRFWNKFRMTDSINPFSIVESYSIAILCKYFFKDFYDIISVIWNRENSIILLTFEWNSMRLKPISTFSRRKFSECFFYKISTTCVLRKKYFLIFYSCSEIASSTSRYHNLVSWSFIFFKNMDMKILFFGWF